MNSFLTYRGLVYPWQCDHMGHMNVMWYTGKFDEASWSMLARLGLTQARLRGLGRAMAAVQQNITYKQELYAGDLVSIRTRIVEVRSKVLRFIHEMTNEATGDIAAVAELTGVHMDALTRRSTEFPAEFHEAFQDLSEAGIETCSFDGEKETVDNLPVSLNGYASMCD